MNSPLHPGSPPDSPWHRLAPWIGLGLALGWTVAIRIPLVLNAEVHLDSDLAVDGLTLLDAVHGRWRWHYPGTPYMGIGPVLLSWLQGWAWGVNPITLVSGGTAAHVLIVLGTFALGWRVFGREVACWSLVPLTFCSTGVLWMSGRITGGHLTIVSWSAWAWLLFHEASNERGSWRLCLLGVWCGLGLWLDSLFLATLAGMAAAGVFAAWLRMREGECDPTRLSSAWSTGRRATTRASGSTAASDDTRPTRLQTTLVGSAAAASLFLAGFFAGVTPRFIGKAVDPHDAYNEQFSGSLDSSLLAEHGRILLLDCLPRLIAGHRLPGLESDPDPGLLGSGGPVQQRGGREKARIIWTEAAVTIASLGLCAAAMVGLAAVAVAGRNPDERIIAAGLTASGLGIAAGFLVNRNIFNSDNSRYLVPLIIPWAIGLGCLLRRIRRIAGCGMPAALVLALGLAVLFTVDTAAWYLQLGWVDERLVPVRRRLEFPALRWLDEHPEVSSLYGDYWDVYRLSFLTSGKVRGVPFRIFPNRFPEWSAEMPAGRPETMLIRTSNEGRFFLNAALREGGKIIHRDRGLTIVDWPVKAAIHKAPRPTIEDADASRTTPR
jgi:hypothetical protein